MENDHRQHLQDELFVAQMLCWGYYVMLGPIGLRQRKP